MNSKRRSDFRSYFREIGAINKHNPVYQEKIKLLLDTVDTLYDAKGTVKNPEPIESKITLMVAQDPVLQEMILGVRFIPNRVTEIKTNSYPFDVSGEAFYINEKLRNKYFIQERDSINVEFKVTYSISGLTEKQLSAAQNGVLGCVVAFRGSWTNEVEGTDCPIISFRKLPKLASIDQPFYSDEIEIAVLELLDKAVSNCPSMYKTIGDLNNRAELLLFASDPCFYRHPLHIIMYLGKFHSCRCRRENESEEGYRLRIINRINDTLNHPHFIEDLDGPYPYRQERFRKRYALRRASQGIKEVIDPKTDLFNIDGTNCLYSVRDEAVEVNGEIERERIIYIATWLVEAFGLESEIHMVKDVSSWSHLFQNRIPRANNSKTLSPDMREKLKVIFAKYILPNRGKEDKPLGIAKIKMKNQHHCQTRKEQKRLKELETESSKWGYIST